MSADLEYVFGPVVATTTLVNLNLQFHRVHNRQESDRRLLRGWAWTSDEDDLEGDATGGDYEIDPEQAISDVCEALRVLLTERVEEWREEHPRAAAIEAEVLSGGVR